MMTLKHALYRLFGIFVQGSLHYLRSVQEFKKYRLLPTETGHILSVPLDHALSPKNRVTTLYFSRMV